MKKQVKKLELKKITCANLLIGGSDVERTKIKTRGQECKEETNNNQE